MGRYLSTYAGPVILAEFSLEKTLLPFPSCGNKKCQRHEKSLEHPFCPQCGEPSVTLQKAYTDENPSSEVLEAAGIDPDTLEDQRFLDNELPENHHLYTPNTRDRSPPRDFGPENPECCIIDLTEIDIEAEMKWMKTAYAPEIKKMRSLYKKVEIRWMFLNYRS